MIEWERLFRGHSTEDPSLGRQRLRAARLAAAGAARAWANIATGTEPTVRDQEASTYHTLAFPTVAACYEAGKRSDKQAAIPLTEPGADLARRLLNDDTFDLYPPPTEPELLHQSPPMNIRIAVAARKTEPAGWTVRLTCQEHADLNYTRELGRTGGEPPFLLPQDNPPTWIGQPDEQLCAGNDHATQLRNAATGDDPTAVETVGAYLCATLLGPGGQRVLDRAAETGNRYIEPALDFAEAPELHALPWEMMFWDGHPLVGLQQCVVSITRIVPLSANTKAGAPAVGMSALGRPLRVLFVVGRQLDPVLRPGAEVFGVLRHLSYQTDRIDESGTQLRAHGLHIRLLVEATTDEFKQTVKEFRPHVAHIVCHGRGSGQGARLVFAASDKSQTKEELWSAGDLLTRFLDAGWSPPVVVLNARRTATTRPGDSEHLSFAAQLVAGGIRLAIGMAGEVEDATCQMFTRRLYHALVNQASVPQAVATARRAGILHFGQHRASGEWARPTVFWTAGPDLTLAATTRPRS